MHVVILSDVHGVYKNREDPSTIIRVIDNIDSYAHLAEDSNSENGTGGMQTKFAAAKIVTESRMQMRIVHGRTENAIQRALNNEIGTLFLPVTA